MKFKMISAAILAVFLIVMGCQSMQEPTAMQENFDQPMSLAKGSVSQVIPGQYIVVFNDNVDDVPGMANALARSHSAEVGYVYQHALKGFAVKMSDRAAMRMAENPNIKYIEPDYIATTSKGGPPGGGGGTPPPQQTPWGISRVNGGVTYSGNSVAWVIDTGIDLDHPDLNVDASRGWSGYSKRGQPVLEDGDGHGTHVSGTIAAIDNSIGVVGVAAGATVIPVKVLSDQGSGSYSTVIAGVNHVAANGNPGDVANMSLGGPVSQALDDAVASAAQSSGVKFCLAAGNESDDANNHSPARTNGNNVYTVSASDINDNWAYFSNYGNPPVDYCEPGYSIYSTYKSGGYATLSGTSMATPHLAGILLLGNVRNGGTVNGDPDGNADTIGIH